MIIHLNITVILISDKCRTTLRTCYKYFTRKCSHALTNLTVSIVENGL